MKLLLASSALLAFALGGCAGTRPLAPNGPIELAPDEGILVIHTATDLPITHLDLDGGHFLSDIPAGTRFQLFAAREGRHRFTALTVVERDDDGRAKGGFVKRLKDEPAWRFDVVAGKINYPGQWVIYTDGESRGRRHSFQLANRSALAWRHIQSRHPELLATYPFVFVGSVRDDFMKEFLATEDAE